MHGWSGLESVKGISVAVVTPDGWWAGVFGNDGAGGTACSRSHDGHWFGHQTVTAARVPFLA